MAIIHSRYPNLQRYVEGKNIWAKFGQGKVYDLSHFTHADKAALMKDLECDLSPENLCCDGELSGPALRKKAQYLRAVEAELEAFVCL